jgi:hypothetical protein
MNELTFDGKVYVSSKRAAEITGYAKDYVGQLCREGRVDARLVGRNWYVLETSIREHRFGTKGTVASEESDNVPVVESTWEKPRYVAETPTYIEPLRSTGGVHAATNASFGGKEASMSDMQSAWQEWFTKKSLEPEAPSVKAEIRREEALDTPVVEEEESIPVHITPIFDQTESASYDEAQNEPEETEEIQSTRRGENYGEGRKQLIRASREKWRPNNLVLQSIFIGIAVVSVAISAIGSGFAERIGLSSVYRLPEINLLSGVNTVNR